MKKFLKEYRIELVALLVVSLGIFLLVEPFEIRATLFSWMTHLAGIVRGFASQVVSGLADFINNTTISDVTGLGLIFLAGGFFYWRLWHRMTQHLRFTSDQCPRCGGPIRRAHRTRGDRILGALLARPLRRYTCLDPDCGWRGIRYGGHHKGQHELKDIPAD